MHALNRFCTWLNVLLKSCNSKYFHNRTVGRFLGLTQTKTKLILIFSKLNQLLHWFLWKYLRNTTNTVFVSIELVLMKRSYPKSKLILCWYMCLRLLRHLPNKKLLNSSKIDYSWSITWRSIPITYMRHQSHIIIIHQL